MGGLVLPGVDILHDLFFWLDTVSISGNKKTILQTIIQTTLWVIWRYRNGIIFGDSNPIKNRIFEDIVGFSYN